VRDNCIAERLSHRRPGTQTHPAAPSGSRTLQPFVLNTLTFSTAGAFRRKRRLPRCAGTEAAH